MSASPRTVLTAAAAAQASVSIVAFGLPAVGPDLREAYGLSLTMLGAALAATVVFVVAALCTPLLGALAEHAGWNVFWLTAAVLAAAGASLAATLPAAAGKPLAAPTLP